MRTGTVNHLLVGQPWLSWFFLGFPLLLKGSPTIPAQGSGIGAKGADARGVGGAEHPPPSKSFYGHPKGQGAQALKQPLAGAL